MSILSNFFQTTSRNDKIISDAKKYFSSRYDLLKLEFLEKSSKIIGGILMMLTVVISAFVALVFLAQALISWLSQFFTTAAPVYLICAGVFIILIIVALFSKESLFINPMVKMLSKIMYEDDSADDDKIGGEDE